MSNGILYVITNDWIRDPETNITPYKIGITKNSIGERYYGLGLKMPGTFKALFAYKLENYEKAEKFIHGILFKHRVNGEWFNIEKKELDLIKMNCEAMGGIDITDDVKVEIIEQVIDDSEPPIGTTTKEKRFILENNEYIARLYKPKDSSTVHGGIFNGEEKCKNMKSIVREYLKLKGEKPLDSGVNTHTAVKILIELLEKDQ
jgi:hypothetical protein